MSKFTETVKKEFYELIPPTLFFFIALHIVALIRALMAKGSGIPLSSTASIAIAEPAWPSCPRSTAPP